MLYYHIQGILYVILPYPGDIICYITISRGYYMLYYHIQGILYVILPYPGDISDITLSLNTKITTNIIVQKVHFAVTVETKICRSLFEASSFCDVCDDIKLTNLHLTWICTYIDLVLSA